MLWVAIGNQGSGKTVFLIKEAYEYFKKGFKIYSNIHLKFKYEKLNYEKIIKCEYHDCIILLDEIHLLLGSRTSMSKKNDAITTSFCSQLRKQNVTILASSQRLGKIDKRLRSELTFLIECDRYVFQNNQFIYKAYDDRTTDKNTPTFIKCTVTDVNTEQSVKHYFCANEYFNLYDSHEIVIIEGIDEYFENEKQLKKEKLKNDK